MRKIILSDLFCSIGRALLKKVTPNLRAVTVAVSDNTTFEVFYYYDQAVSEKEKELFDLAKTEILSDFPFPDYKTAFNVEFLKSTDRVPNDKFNMYERYHSK